MLSYPEETLVVEETTTAQKTMFFPAMPQSLEETGLPDVLVEDLVLKLLFSRGVLSGREMAEEVCLPFKIIQPILAELKQRMFITHKTTAALGDFIYNLTDQGKQAALLSKDYSAYFGAAPVIFEAYVESVNAQSLRHEHPTPEDLKRAYSDILLDDAVLATLGPAINSGKGLFLFGDPGNGKTSIAERIANCFKDHIYIPKALWIDGEIIQLFDPQNHEVVPPDDLTDRLDSRWVKIKRPTVVVGGELTMNSLDIIYNETLKISEAPLQMKANGGTFLIDDFGRQRVDHKELLNRWIIPLEKQYDFLVLPNGRKIQVPFEQLIIFSTNLNPRDLVDDAFLRRIPYKVEVENPTPEAFRELFRLQCQRVSVPYDDELVTYLIERHYNGKRQMRACHPRDLLDQIINRGLYEGAPPRMTRESLDKACQNYFAAMGTSA